MFLDDGRNCPAFLEQGVCLLVLPLGFPLCDSAAVLRLKLGLLPFQFLVFDAAA